MVLRFGPAFDLADIRRQLPKSACGRWAAVAHSPNRRLYALIGIDKFASDFHAGDSPAPRVCRVDGVFQPAYSHHVAALLIVGVGMKQIIGDIFEQIDNSSARQFVERGGGVGNGGLAHYVFQRDYVTGQENGAPAESG